jgi:hypothetical protein
VRGEIPRLGETFAQLTRLCTGTRRVRLFTVACGSVRHARSLLDRSTSRDDGGARDKRDG